MRVAQKSKPRHPPVGKIHTNVHFAADGKDVNSTSDFLTKITWIEKRAYFRDKADRSSLCAHMQDKQPILGI